MGTCNVIFHTSYRLTFIEWKAEAETERLETEAQKRNKQINKNKNKNKSGSSMEAGTEIMEDFKVNGLKPECSG